MHMNLSKNLLIMFAIIAWLTPGNVVRANDCDEAKRLYDKGLDLLDDSKTEASYYQKAIELCPDFFEAHNRLGEVYKSWGEYESAIKEFNEAGRDPLFAEPHNNLGEIYRMQGMYDLAAEEFIRAIEIKPDFRAAQNQLKYVYKRLGKYDFVVETSRLEKMPIPIFSRIPGMTLPKGKFLVDFQYEYFEQEIHLEETSYFERKVDVNKWVLGIRYGLSNNFTIGLMPKFFSKKADIEMRELGINPRPEVSGFGDTVLMMKYRLLKTGRTHISAFHLLSIPTGDDDAEGESHRVKRRIPLGSGNFDFTPGMAITTAIEPLTIHADISYKIATSDQFCCNLAVASPRFHNFVSIMELNYRWNDNISRRQKYQIKLERPPEELETLEMDIEEKAGHTLFLSPGLQFFLTKGFKVELGVKIPIIKPDDKDTMVEDAVFHVGLMKYFF